MSNEGKSIGVRGNIVIRKVNRVIVQTENPIKKRIKVNVRVCKMGNGKEGFICQMINVKKGKKSLKIGFKNIEK